MTMQFDNEDWGLPEENPPKSHRLRNILLGITAFLTGGAGGLGLANKAGIIDIPKPRDVIALVAGNSTTDESGSTPTPQVVDGRTQKPFDNSSLPVKTMPPGLTQSEVLHGTPEFNAATAANTQATVEAPSSTVTPAATLVPTATEQSLNLDEQHQRSKLMPGGTQAMDSTSAAAVELSGAQAQPIEFWIQSQDVEWARSVLLAATDFYPAIQRVLADSDMTLEEQRQKLNLRLIRSGASTDLAEFVYSLAGVPFDSESYPEFTTAIDSVKEQLVKEVLAKIVAQMPDSVGVTTLPEGAGMWFSQSAEEQPVISEIEATRSMRIVRRDSLASQSGDGLIKAMQEQNANQPADLQSRIAVHSADPAFSRQVVDTAVELYEAYFEKGGEDAMQAELDRMVNDGEISTVLAEQIRRLGFIFFNLDQPILGTIQVFQTPDGVVMIAFQPAVTFGGAEVQ